METEVLVALIGSVCSLIGVIITSSLSNKKQSKERKCYQEDYDKKIDEYKDVTLYRIKQLEKKQEKYNKLQERIATDERVTAEIKGTLGEIKEEMKTIRNYITNDRE